MKVAIISGYNGQDGTYLKKILNEKGYKLKFIHEVLNEKLIRETIQSCSEYDVIEIYNLAAQSHVNISTASTFEVNTMGILNILEAVRALKLEKKCKIFQASSSEIFGSVNEIPQDENTPYNPTSLYGISKLSAHLLAKYYRDVYKMYVCSGILYNHESPLRKDTFVTQKIIKGLKTGTCITMGNIFSRRDWGHAEDYVEAMWLILQQSNPSDYVVATGVAHSVRDFIEITANKLGKKIIWSGKGENGIGSIDGKESIKVSSEFYRPTDVNTLVGNPSKLESIGWKRKYDIHDIIEDMLK